MKNSIKIMAMLIVILVAMLCMASCGWFKPAHTHIASNEAVVVKAPTCNTPGESNVCCMECGDVLETITIPATGNHNAVVISAVAATCSSTGRTEGSKCKDCNTILVEQKETPKISHTEVTLDAVESTCAATGLTAGTKCSVCNEILIAQTPTEKKSHTPGEWVVSVKPTKTEDGTKILPCSECNETLDTGVAYATGSLGLVYELSDDGYSYYLANIGTCTDAEVVVPKVYDNKIVTAIGDTAFVSRDAQSTSNPNNTTITTIVLPDTIKTIGKAAFAYCTSLSTIVLPENLEAIDMYAFMGCSSLETIIVPDSVTNLAEYAFANSGLVSITFGNGVTTLPKNLCASCPNLNYITLGEDVVRMYVETFAGCANIRTVKMTEEQWNNADLVYVVNKISSIRTYCEGGIYMGPETNTEHVMVGVSDLTQTEYWIHPNTNVLMGTFKNCSNMTNIVVTEGVEVIAGSTFTNCANLKTIYLPHSLEKICFGAFIGCDNVTDVYYAGTYEEWLAVERENSWSDFHNVTWHFTDREFTE